MESAHFQDFQTATNDQIGKVIESGRMPVLQFSQPPSSELLERADAFCCEFGSEVQIRFFGFGWNKFDTSLLSGLPNVANLSIDTIRKISDFGPIAKLPKLTRLRFGVHEHPDGGFLQQLDLARFTHLTLAENKRRNFDLAPLAHARSLKRLFIQGHHKSIEAISQLPCLEDVSLSGFPKRHDLLFLNELAAMSSLLLILGSRQSIAEFSHPGLRELKIVWVRLLEDLGPLGRFTRLEKLVIEDQLRLTQLDISGLHLRRLHILNCKNLKRITGLEEQSQLKDFTMCGTKLPNIGH
jgi:hypothetical protein